MSDSMKRDKASSCVKRSGLLSVLVISFLILVGRDGVIMANFKTYFKSLFFLNAPWEA